MSLAHRFLKGIPVFLVILFLPLFIFNLLLGNEGSIVFIYTFFLGPGMYFPTLFIAAFLLSLIYTTNLENSKKQKYFWLVILGVLVYKIILLFQTSGGFDTIVLIMVYGSELGALILINLFLLYLSKLEDKKQYITIWLLLLLLLILNIIQHYGILRLGLME